MGAMKKETAETTERLVAVVLADSFAKQFQPISVERPKVLLPLVNAPMLDYTLEWLAINGMEDIFVMCCAHADQIETHLSGSGWYNRRNLNVETIVSRDCMSVGDAMRMLDHKDFLKSDFVLVSGDVVSNMDLSRALKEHTDRRSTDKSAIMTMVLKGGMNSEHRLRLGDLGALTVLDSSTQRLLKFEEKRECSPADSKAVQLDIAFWSGRDNVTIRTDLLDTGIYICSPEVPMLFSDNFDYQNVRKDFVSGVLSEEELGNKLYIHEVQNKYATRIRSFRSYGAVSKDILSRWTYPLVPESNLFRSGNEMDDASWLTQQRWGPKESQYRYSKGRVYIDECVSISRDAMLQHTLCIGRGSIIGPSAVIRDSIIGKNCRIGAKAVIIGSSVGDNVRIETGAVIAESVICDDVLIKENSEVQRNCVLSYGVVIDRNTIVCTDTRISLVKPRAGDDITGSDDEENAFGTSPGCESTSGFSECDEGSHSVDRIAGAAARALASGGVPEGPTDFDVKVVGTMGAGYVWSRRLERDPLSVSRKSLAYDIEALALQENDIESHKFLAEENSLAAHAEEELDQSDAESDGMGVMGDSHFQLEVAETFLRCIKENISQDNVVIELNGLKIAEDKTFADCARFLLTTALGLCLTPPPFVPDEYQKLYATDEPNSETNDGKLLLLKRAAQQLKQWSSLLHKFSKNEDDQVEILLTLEDFCSGDGEFESTGEKGSAFASIFPQILKLMYELDILTEEAIDSWAREKEFASEQEKKYLKLAKPFLEWLSEAEEESSEESDDSDE